ncbi:MAG: hypothetical protein QM770_00915 [Tepidisphaeraceae bacterium]
MDRIDWPKLLALFFVMMVLTAITNMVLHPPKRVSATAPTTARP